MLRSCSLPPVRRILSAMIDPVTRLNVAREGRHTIESPLCPSGPAQACLMAGLIIVSISVAGCTADPSEELETMASPSSVGEQPDAEGIRPFTIEISDEVLTDLEDRLARSRLPDQIPGTGWDYGANRAYMEELLTYWQDGFDWRAQERRLNEFDHFKTVIDGVDVHFIHQRSARGGRDAVAPHAWMAGLVRGVLRPHRSVD